MKTTFIYFLKDPMNPVKGYVGKSNNPKRRLRDHLCDDIEENNYRANWLRTLKARGLMPDLEIVDEVPFEHWPQLEVAYIEFFLEQGYVLTNSAPGGEDPPMGWGRKKSPEEIAKFVAAVSGEKHWTFKKDFTPEHCAKISAAGKNRKYSLEEREKRSVAKLGTKNPMFGKKLSPAQLAARKGSIPWNKGAVGLQVAWNKGKPMPEEQKAKISAAKKGSIPWNKGNKKV